MRLKEFDVRLAALQSELQFATENILELSELPLTRQLRADLESPQSKLCGLTRDCACAALADIDHTLQWILRLKDALERAATVRQSLWMTQENKAHELDQLLSGPSIQLPPVPAPLLARSLTGPAELPQATTIRELQSRMATAFDCAKRTLATLQAARDTNTKRLARSEQEIAALEQLAAELNVADRAWSAALRKTVAELTAQLETDPLHVSEALKREFEGKLRSARQNLRAWSDERDGVVRSLVRAEQKLEDLAALQSRASALRAECSARIAGGASADATLTTAGLADLRQWLAALKQSMPAQWQAVRTGLQKWLKKVELALNHEHAVVVAQRRPLEQLTELRERFTTVKAKAHRSDENAQKLFAAAEQALRARPVRLEVCAKLVHACEQVPLKQGAEHGDVAISGAPRSARQRK